MSLSGNKVYVQLMTGGETVGNFLGYFVQTSRGFCSISTEKWTMYKCQKRHPEYQKCEKTLRWLGHSPRLCWRAYHATQILSWWEESRYICTRGTRVVCQMEDWCPWLVMDMNVIIGIVSVVSLLYVIVCAQRRKVCTTCHSHWPRAWHNGLSPIRTFWTSLQARQLCLWFV